MPSLRDDRRRHTADSIIEAAEQLIVDGDPESLTIHAVAAAIEVTPGALYRYFPSRDAIVAAVQLRVIRDLGAAVDAAADAVPADVPLGRLAAAVGAVVGFARREPGRYALVSRMLATPRPLVGDEEAAPVVAVAAGWLDRLRARFAAARCAGLLAPGDDGSRVLVAWATVHGAVQLDKLRRFSPEADAARIGRAGFEALLLGWGAPPAAARLAMSHFEPLEAR